MSETTEERTGFADTGALPDEPPRAAHPADPADPAPADPVSPDPVSPDPVPPQPGRDGTGPGGPAAGDPADGTDPSPDPDAGPDRDGTGTGSDADPVAEAVSTLRAALEQNTRAYEHQQELLDRLHRENEDLRAAAQQRTQDPIIRDLITLSDTCLRNARVWQSKESAQPADVDTALRHISDDIQLILDRFGVDAFRPEAGAPFNRREARAVRSVDSADPARAAVVAEVLTPGFRIGERVLRYAEVVVWRHVEP